MQAQASTEPLLLQWLLRLLRLLELQVLQVVALVPVFVIVRGSLEYLQRPQFHPALPVLPLPTQLLYPVWLESWVTTSFLLLCG